MTELKAYITISLNVSCSCVYTDFNHNDHGLQVTVQNHVNNRDSASPGLAIIFFIFIYFIAFKLKLELKIRKKKNPNTKNFF